MKMLKNSVLDNFCFVDFVGVICVFLFVFSFYIVGPITSSMVVSFCLLPYYLLKRNRKCLFVSNYFLAIFLFLALSIFLCVIYTNVIHSTGDLSYAKILFGQLVQLFLSFPVLCFFIETGKVKKIEEYIIIAFFVQSVIEIIALFSPSLVALILYFSRAGDLYEGSGGVRGLALASGVGWNLALSFGVVYILIAKRILQSNTICFVDYLMFIIISVGTFFAGRTGFVGMLYAGIMILIHKHFNILYVLKILLMPTLIFSLLYLLSLFVPVLYNMFNEKVLPFAFEWYYNMDSTGRISMSSTDILMEMWKVPISFKTLLMGDGWFYDISGEFYYKRTDVGVLRNILYWGVFGYLVMIIYQVKQFYPLFNINNIYKLTGVIILLYLFTMELKAMTVGFNKTVFSLVILFVYSYIYQSYIDKRLY